MKFEQQGGGAGYAFAQAGGRVGFGLMPERLARLKDRFTRLPGNPQQPGVGAIGGEFQGLRSRAAAR